MLNCSVNLPIVWLIVLRSNFADDSSPIPKLIPNKVKVNAIIEMYYFYEEVFFLDEFYVWSNKKNGCVYSWFEKGKENELISESEA